MKNHDLIRFNLYPIHQNRMAGFRVLSYSHRDKQGGKTPIPRQPTNPLAEGIYHVEAQVYIHLAGSRK